MSTTNSEVIAIFCSDPHLSLTAPPLRSREPDWFAAMGRPLSEIKALQAKYECPCYCAGDIFDQWNSPPELINWAVDHLPYMQCIPGQHDLPGHDLHQLKRSAYDTLRRTQAISSNMNPYSIKDPLSSSGQRSREINAERGPIHVYGFPFGKSCTPTHHNPHLFKIALIHQYNATVSSSTQHGGAIPSTQFINSSRKEFSGYDLIFSGDNHIPFVTTLKKRPSHFINCGSIIRRRSPDLLWHPSVWLLLLDGSVQRHRLDVSKDIYLETQETKTLEAENTIDLKGLRRSLEKLDKCILDVKEAFEQAFTNDSPSQKKILLKAMED